MRTSTRRYRHLTVADLEYTVLKGVIEDVRVGDIVLGGRFWVRGIHTDATLAVPAITLDLEQWMEDGAHSYYGRLTLPTGSPMTIVRIVTLDPEVAVAEYDAASAPGDRSVPSINLQPDDRVWFYGNTVEVKEVWPTGLIIFDGGIAYQSQPSLFWGLVETTTD